MKRKIEHMACQVASLDTAALADDIAVWFQRQPSVGDPAWFLAHADDGVIWGQIRQGKLALAARPKLDTTTLQQARLFGEKAEVRVWRDGQDLVACRLQDQPDETAEALDEEHLLWGTQSVAEPQDGFTLLADGRQGLRHAVPLAVAATAFDVKGRYHPVRLRLRHYLSYDADGHVHVHLSRLLGLRQRPRGGQDESPTS